MLKLPRAGDPRPVNQEHKMLSVPVSLEAIHISACVPISANGDRFFHACTPQVYKNFSIYAGTAILLTRVLVRRLKEMRNEVKIMWA